MKTRISGFLGQKSKANNLATVGSITWPHFCSHFLGTCGQVIDRTVLIFLIKVFFFSKISFSLQKEEVFSKKIEKGNETKVARLLTLLFGKCGQVIDIYIYRSEDTHTHIYIYIYIYAVVLLSGPSLAF